MDFSKLVDFCKNKLNGVVLEMKNGEKLSYEEFVAACITFSQHKLRGAKLTPVQWNVLIPHFEYVGIMLGDQSPAEYKDFKKNIGDVTTMASRFSKRVGMFALFGCVEHIEKCVIKSREPKCEKISVVKKRKFEK